MKFLILSSLKVNLTMIKHIIHLSAQQFFNFKFPLKFVKNTKNCKSYWNYLLNFYFYYNKELKILNNLKYLPIL